MRLKVGFILRSLLVIGTFLGLVLLWSSLSPKAGDETPFGKLVSVFFTYSHSFNFILMVFVFTMRPADISILPSVCLTV